MSRPMQSNLKTRKSKKLINHRTNQIQLSNSQKRLGSRSQSNRKSNKRCLRNKDLQLKWLHHLKLLNQWTLLKRIRLEIFQISRKALKKCSQWLLIQMPKNLLQKYRSKFNSRPIKLKSLWNNNRSLSTLLQNQRRSKANHKPLLPNLNLNKNNKMMKKINQKLKSHLQLPSS